MKTLNPALLGILGGALLPYYIAASQKKREPIKPMPTWDVLPETRIFVFMVPGEGPRALRFDR